MKKAKNTKKREKVEEWQKEGKKSCCKNKEKKQEKKGKRDAKKMTPWLALHMEKAFVPFLLTHFLIIDWGMFIVFWGLEC